MATKPAENLGPTRQWGIKTISSKTVEEMTDAAPKMGLHSGTLIEKIWGFWKSNGADQQPVDMMAELAKLVTSLGPFNEHNPMPRDLRKLVNAYARATMANTLGTQPQLAAPRPVQPRKQPGITDQDKDPRWAHLKHLAPPEGKTGLEDLEEIAALDE